MAALPAPPPALKIAKVSVEQYLALEQQSKTRHEYVDGLMVAMAGEKRRHNRLGQRFVRLLGSSVDAKGCEMAIENIKIRSTRTRFRYPDIVVSCQPGDDAYWLANPCFIAEILSDSTARSDTVVKLEEYKNIPSLDRYAIVEQSQPLVLLYKRMADHWEVEVLNLGDEFDIPCLGVSVKLSDLYEGVVFDDDGGGAEG
jgi:Uma2 family endonuclease